MHIVSMQTEKEMWTVEYKTELDGDKMVRGLCSNGGDKALSR